MSTMITPEGGIYDYEPFTELDSQLEPYDDPVPLYLRETDAAYCAMGLPGKARFRVTSSLDELRERYPDTYFGLPVNDAYDEEWLYGDDLYADHDNCWCSEWTFRLDKEREHFGGLGPDEYVLALRIGSPDDVDIGLPYGNVYRLIFRFQYDPKFENPIGSSFENIELWYAGSWEEYNELMEYLTDTYGGGEAYRRGPLEADVWAPFDPLEDR